MGANQTWRPDAVIINFPYRVKRLSDKPLAIPKEAKTWAEQYSWLTVRQTDDYGPATKLLGTLQVETDPDTIIVILDDDTYYHHDTILSLVSTMMASSTDIAPCFQCEEVWKDWFGFGKLRWKYAETEGRCKGFASGYAAYAVRPRYFDHSVWNHSLGPEGCRLHDDVWISGSMLVASGVRPYLIRPGFDSVQQEYIRAHGRPNESVHVAHMAEIKQGRDPQRRCVEHFTFHHDTGNEL